MMTSCDGGLMRQLPVQLMAIADNMAGRDVHIYLFHDGSAECQFAALRSFCQKLDNISLHSVIIRQKEDYDELARMGGGWSGEAYYGLCAHEYLPDSLDRIMYLDAGDTLVLRDPSDYYFADFGDNVMTASCTHVSFNSSGEVFFFEADDIYNLNYLPTIVGGIFNSGSYVINLEKMREISYHTADYLALGRALAEVQKKDENVYFGDQGLLSAAFVGSINYYGKEKAIEAKWLYEPYNFCLGQFNLRPAKAGYEPYILHFSGTPMKPWQARFPIFSPEFQDDGNLRSLDELSLGQAEYFYLWHEYALKASRLMGEI